MRNYPTVHKKRIGQANGWGPHSKKLAGIAHIAEEDKGTSDGVFRLSVTISRDDAASRGNIPVQRYALVRKKRSEQLWVSV